jgi:hypothetical protein
MSRREVLLEYHRVGAAVKVTAVDPETLVEVSIQAPASLPESALERAAINKLRYVLGRSERRERPAPRGIVA